MQNTEEQLFKAFKKHSGGVGEPLDEEEQRKIRDGIKNHAENHAPYDSGKLLEGGSVFMKNHPVDWLEEA